MSSWPECLACEQGVLVPLSDFGGQGASVHYKAWVCTSPIATTTLRFAMAIYTLTNRFSRGPEPAEAKFRRSAVRFRTPLVVTK